MPNGVDEAKTKLGVLVPVIGERSIGRGRHAHGNSVERFSAGAISPAGESLMVELAVGYVGDRIG